jgi:hypothetical protein
MKVLTSLLVVVITLTTTAVSAEVNVSEQVVGPSAEGGTYIISPSGGRVAYTGTKGSRLVVLIDGIEGPVFDELFNPYGDSYFTPARPKYAAFTANPGGRTNAAAQPAPVIMSADGLHYAYVGRQGDEYVVIHDGKEIARGPRQSLALNYGPLTLSPTGRHVYWNESNGPGNSRWLQRLVVSGKPGPWSGHQDMLPVFSAGDAHYAYVMISPDDANKQVLILDGKEAGYDGHSPVFTADGQHLITLSSAAATQALQIDGKASINSRGISDVVTAPVGSGYGAIVFKDVQGAAGVKVLFINGKEIAGTEGVQKFWFSPDGKHFAAACQNAAARSMFMVVDGHKSVEYQGINTGNPPIWTADSSRLIYMVTSGGRSFVIVDGKEFEVAYLDGSGIMITPRGNHYAYHSYDGSNRIHSLIIDGESVLLAGYYPQAFGLSDDGSRYAYMVSTIGRSDIAGMVVDGKLIENFAPQYIASLNYGNKGFLFSPDSKHLAQVGSSTGQQSQGLYVDGKLVVAQSRPFNNLTFTPDSNHLVWLSSETFPDRPQPYFSIYVDGERVIKTADYGLLNVPGAWDMGKDGVLKVIANDGDQLKSYRIKPSADMTIAKLVSDAEVNRAKAMAAKEAADKQAAEDAAAARAKADADRAAAAAKAKADADAAAAKRKADYDAAVAAKKKAREDAIAAKQKARLDAIAAKKLAAENARRKKQGLPPLAAPSN